MGQRRLTIYTDDRDGSDLEGEPGSVHLAFRDQSWNLNLSDQNLQELEQVVKDAAAERGWVDGAAVALEHLTAVKRAGADVILTYLARELAETL